MKKRLYIENIPAKVSAEDLGEWLQPFGTVARIEMTDDSPCGGGRSGYV